MDGLAGKKRKKSGSTSGDAKKVKAVFGGDDDDDVDDEDQDRKIAAKPTPNGNGDAKPAKLVEAAAAAQAGMIGWRCAAGMAEALTFCADAA